MASLLFRVGICDERVPDRGITHLVEHLGMFAVGQREHPVNGFVALTNCALFGMGTQEELERFLADATSGLSDLPLDRLEDEKRVLQRESAASGFSLASRMMSHRFGNRGFGAADLVELGLRWLGRDEVDSWRRGWFTAGNAALWVHGPAPPASGLTLPPGERRPVPPDDPLPGSSSLRSSRRTSTAWPHPSWSPGRGPPASRPGSRASGCTTGCACRKRSCTTSGGTTSPSRPIGPT